MTGLGASVCDSLAVNSTCRVLQVLPMFIMSTRATHSASGSERRSLLAQSPAAARCRRCSADVMRPSSCLSPQQRSLRGAGSRTTQRSRDQMILLRQSGHGAPRTSRCTHSVHHPPVNLRRVSCACMKRAVVAPHGCRMRFRILALVITRIRHDAYLHSRLIDIRARAQVADFMDDVESIQRDAAALAQACYDSGASHGSDALINAVLALPQHLQQAVSAQLLRDRELPQLLDALPAVLLPNLLATAAQRSSADECGAASDCNDRRGQARDASGRMMGCLQLCDGAWSIKACAALCAHIPLLPPLCAAVCAAELSAAALIQALSVHTALTRLDVSGANLGHSRVSMSAFADALPSWPHLRSLRLGRSHRKPSAAMAAASDMLAPALAESALLTALHLSCMQITSELACAVGTLTQLANLHLHGCVDAKHVFPHLASLPHLRALGARGALLRLEGARNHTEPTVSAGIAACTSLLHLDLHHSLTNAAGLELAALPHLESLHLQGCNADSSTKWRDAESVPPFVASAPACRSGLRGLPHLQQLTTLSFGRDFASLDSAAARALGAALPLLPRLQRLAVHSQQDPAAQSALAEGWARAPALCALTCVIWSDAALLPDSAAIAPALQGLTSLDVSVFTRVDEDTEAHEIMSVSRICVPISQLTRLRSLGIHGMDDDDDDTIEQQATLRELSAFTDLRRLKLTRVDVTCVKWAATPLCALTAICLIRCYTKGTLPALAVISKLQSLAMYQCEIDAGDIDLFVTRRMLRLAGGPPLDLDFDVRHNWELVTVAGLKQMLQSAEHIGLRHVRVPHLGSESATELIAAFNSKWGRLRDCVQQIC